MTHRQRIIKDLTDFTRSDHPGMALGSAFVREHIRSEADKSVRDLRRWRRSMMQKKKAVMRILFQERYE